ncbi:MAG: 3-hydroxyacyl-CoA dehydrogenase [Acetobacteraceae bacterium]|nr:3-hydroxyacyl-CoA dehydrogenase [Acetobacteraceae bacterium]
MSGPDSRTAVSRVAVVGTGVIGASWAALFLAQGLDVAATDPAPEAEAALRRTVETHWPVLERIGLRMGASPDRLRFHSSLEAALESVQFVQESGPERSELKQELYRRMDAATAEDVLLASSSSTKTVSQMQAACVRPGRVVLGHPFNPPHLIPLVEVVGGQRTEASAIDRTMAFYSAIGKRPIRLQKEVLGHIANRLQAALWQEAFHLVETGVASVADIDVAIAHGPGLRWALLGPFLNLHLSGGAGGMRYLLDHLGPPTEDMWRDLGVACLTEPLKETIVNGTNEELARINLEEVVRRRDELLVQLVKLKNATDLP